MLFSSSCWQDGLKLGQNRWFKGVEIKLAAHQSGHGGEVERFVQHELPQDVNDVEVLSVHGVLLKLLHVLPVLQCQTDLQKETHKKHQL